MWRQHPGKAAGPSPQNSSAQPDLLDSWFLREPLSSPLKAGWLSLQARSLLSASSVPMPRWHMLSGALTAAWAAGSKMGTCLPSGAACRADSLFPSLQWAFPTQCHTATAAAWCWCPTENGLPPLETVQTQVMRVSNKTPWGKYLIYILKV